MISIISAMSKNGVIGKDNKLPWAGLEEYKWDMKQFKHLTLGNYVIMGRNTFESMGSKGLKGRKNILITKDVVEYDNPTFKSDHNIEEVFGSLEEAINYCERKAWSDYDTTFIIGGESIYRYALEKNLVDSVYLTVFDSEFEGDKKFPIELLDPAKNKNITGVDINTLLNNNENGRTLLYFIRKHF
jgi:dihydrofolate reductase